MTEDEARSWLIDAHVPRETLVRLDQIVRMVIAENRNQNIIAASTIDQIWARHVVDSVQLLRHANEADTWCDLGTGAGFPGLVVAAFARFEMVLVEGRAKRAAFLRACVDRLDLADRTTIAEGKAEALVLPEPFDVISARAFAPLERIFALSDRLGGPDTVWILPKGRGAASELEAARATWQGRFELVPSVTDSNAAIIVARHVERRRKRR